MNEKISVTAKCLQCISEMFISFPILSEDKERINFVCHCNYCGSEISVTVEEAK